MYMRKCDTMMAGYLGGMRMDIRESGGRKSPSLLIIATLAAVALTAEAVGLLTDTQPWFENPSTNFGWFLTAKAPLLAPNGSEAGRILRSPDPPYWSN